MLWDLLLVNSMCVEHEFVLFALDWSPLLLALKSAALKSAPKVVGVWAAEK